jgi:AcrR family transcriptional regulator
LTRRWRRLAFVFETTCMETSLANSRQAVSKLRRMATAETDGRLRRSEATRSALVAAARKLFTERGYAGVSTAEIVEAAGVTRNALYYHFPTKESLFRAVY